MGLDMVLYKIDKPTETENTIYFKKEYFLTSMKICHTMRNRHWINE